MWQFHPSKLLKAYRMYLTTETLIAEAFYSTQKWAGQIRREMGLEYADKENLPSSYP